ncbi:hypothetical protein COO91_06290 [Nostoc flagelliforme CCNUN1]|uniref:Uncharacterized protein n=1 Tax=Nostoc flagelliforme CCNUN1 TaxID=2038116 RepID=A0A2K8SXV9_9NOSO|nr:hypothetical protein COO91_06290 [Nostoc flagelliforme CCNUN1]
MRRLGATPDALRSLLRHKSKPLRTGLNSKLVRVALIFMLFSQN